MLVFIAIELGLAASRTDKWWVTLIVGIVSLFTNIAIGFSTGLIVEKAISHESNT
ncbi:MAG: hypothetical protein ABEJ25_05620 [Candidatus Bipolaricaulia bacterium]